MAKHDKFTDVVGDDGKKYQFVQREGPFNGPAMAWVPAGCEDTDEDVEIHFDANGGAVSAALYEVKETEMALQVTYSLDGKIESIEILDRLKSLVRYL